MTEDGDDFSRSQSLLQKNVFKMRHSLRRFSTYALQPSPKWLDFTPIIPVLVVAYLSLATICFLVDPGSLVVRTVYTAMGSAGLLFRIRYFDNRHWLLFFIDLCFVTTIVLLLSLWWCFDKGGRCTQEFMLAIYAVCTGPVPGATFLLQTPMTVHHAESFESFFLHATPMWLVYYFRWVCTEDVFFDDVPPVSHIIWCGFLRFYLVWVVPYLIFNLLQPFLPGKLAGYLTLMDPYTVPADLTTDERLEVNLIKQEEKRAQWKRDNYTKFAPLVVVFVFAHALLSLSGFAAAALAFRSWNTQMVWIVSIQLQGIISGLHFYMKSGDDKHQMPSILFGLALMGLTWCFVLVVYFFFPGETHSGAS